MEEPKPAVEDMSPETGVSTKEEIGEQSRLATEMEHQMSFLEACKLYPAAVGWSIFFSIGVVMTAFDPQLLGNLYATSAFQKDFGYLFEGNYIISAAWQTGLGMGNPIGQVVGALAAAYPMEWYGRKKVGILARGGVWTNKPRHLQLVWF
jgi:SP family general alpha glucoside:H+ symporter-like MFS transporter